MASSGFFFSDLSFLERGVAGVDFFGSLLLVLVDNGVVGVGVLRPLNIMLKVKMLLWSRYRLDKNTRPSVEGGKKTLGPIR